MELARRTVDGGLAVLDRKTGEWDYMRVELPVGIDLPEPPPLSVAFIEEDEQ